jgi:hypothetical protein
MIEDPNGFVFAPGVYDGFSARVADAVGFDCLYMVRQPRLQPSLPPIPELSVLEMSVVLLVSRDSSFSTPIQSYERLTLDS